MLSQLEFFKGNLTEGTNFEMQAILIKRTSRDVEASSDHQKRKVNPAHSSLKGLEMVFLAQ